MPPTPPPRPSTPAPQGAPQRPTSWWTPAKPTDKSAETFFHPDNQTIPEFAEEFDTIPIPDANEITGRLICNKDNMEYIKSTLPMPHVGIQDFYTQMAKRQWQAAQPFVRRDGSAMHVAKGMLAIGARRDLGTNPMLKDASRPMMPGGFAKDWNLATGLQRVNAYAFRGDKRHPRAIKTQGGFFPPSTRTDANYSKIIADRFVGYMKGRFGQDVKATDVEEYIKGKGQAGRVFVEYEIWRAIMKSEELHLGRMTANEFLKGYTSTTRDVGRAWDFLGMSTGGLVPLGIKAVYAVHSEGGFMLPKVGSHAYAHFDEAEIAHPGPILWSKIKAFRVYQTRDDKFTDFRTFKTGSVLFIRKGFQNEDPEGAKQVIWSLASLQNINPGR